MVGHAAHGDVSDAAVELVCNAVWSGMGAIFLHSAHFSKPFKRLMGAPCNLTWREAGERERLWLTSRNHPIAAGLPDHFELENEEMLWRALRRARADGDGSLSAGSRGGEVFRSGLTWKRGAGNVFYFRPGHETYTTYRDANVQRVLRNAVTWAYNPARAWPTPLRRPTFRVTEALEPIEERGPRLHHDGEHGFR